MSFSFILHAQMTKFVSPKKHLGQHFLTNDRVAHRIAESLTGHGNYKKVVEVGPGMGMLTHILLEMPYEIYVVEYDTESVSYLKAHYPKLQQHIIEADFLNYDLNKISDGPLAIIGNFPYNISSQILFKVFENYNKVPELVGMFQKEVAERVCSGPGNRDYGILSVLLQAWYDMEYLFSVDENQFHPKPKVQSGVLRMKRNAINSLDCDEKLFKTVVKTAFNQRRKTLRNALRSMCSDSDFLADKLLDKRAEQLTVAEFIYLTKKIKTA